MSVSISAQFVEIVAGTSSYGVHHQTNQAFLIFSHVLKNMGRPGYEAGYMPQWLGFLFDKYMCTCSELCYIISLASSQGHSQFFITEKLGVA